MKQRSVLEKCELFFGLAVAVGAIAALALGLVRLPVPYQLDYEEGNVLNATLLISCGETPYPPMGHFPYVMNPYGPVFYYLLAIPVKIFGPGFTYARLIVLLAGLLTAVLLALLLRHYTNSWKLGFTFGLLYLALPLVRGCLFLLRADLIGIALAVAGLYVFAVHPRWRYLSVLFFVAALFSKYTLVAAPGACLLYLVLQKQWRESARFAISAALLGALAFVGMQYATGGWYAFYMFWTHPDPYSLSHLAVMLRPLLQTHALLMILAGFTIWQAVARRSVSLPVIYLALASVTMLTAGKDGSVQNHFLEWLAAVCLGAGLGYHWLRTQADGAAVLAIVPVALSFSVLMSLPRMGMSPELAGCAQAYEYVRNHPGRRALAENVGAIAMAQKPVLISNPAIYMYLVKWSGWPDADLVERIRSRELDLIILKGDLEHSRKSPTWSAAVHDAIEQNYSLTRRFSCENASAIYEPAGRR